MVEVFRCKIIRTPDMYCIIWKNDYTIDTDLSGDFYTYKLIRHNRTGSKPIYHGDAYETAYEATWRAIFRGINIVENDIKI